MVPNPYMSKIPQRVFGTCSPRLFEFTCKDKQTLLFPEQLECCGVVGYDDWQRPSVPFNATYKGFFCGEDIDNSDPVVRVQRNLRDA